MSALKLQRLSGTDADISLLQRVFEESPSYFGRVTGVSMPPSDEAQKLFSTFPPGTGREAKHVFGIFMGEALVGCLDVVRGYPKRNFAFIGLLLLSESHKGQGVGSEAYRQLEARVTQHWAEVNVLRLSVLESNNIVMPFWRKMGFVETGERKPYESGTFKTEHILFEKALSRVRRGIRREKPTAYPKKR